MLFIKKIFQSYPLLMLSWQDVVLTVPPYPYTVEDPPTPVLYVGLAADVLGRVPLMPLFLLGNSTPTIPHEL